MPRFASEDAYASRGRRPENCEKNGCTRMCCQRANMVAWPSGDGSGL